MRITFLRPGWPPKDEADVPSMDDHVSNVNWLQRHDCSLNNLDAKICGVVGGLGKQFDTLNGKIQRNADGISEQSGSIRRIESKVNSIPQILRDSLEKALHEMLDDKLACFGNEVEGLRHERKEVSLQLEELRKEREIAKREVSELKKHREEIEVKIQDLKSQCELATRQIAALQKQQSETTKLAQEIRGDFAPQVTEFKLSVPVPKKYAQFFSVTTDESHDIEEN